MPMQAAYDLQLFWRGAVWVRAHTLDTEAPGIRWSHVPRNQLWCDTARE